MIEPTLHHVTCPGAGASGSTTHRMAYWEWNQTGRPDHPHVIVCVHGLTRQGRDFDVLARVLSRHARVLCPDVAGRGRSDWLADSSAYGVPQYVQDMLQMLQQVHARAEIVRLDWLGTSMGGLIGMAVAASPALPLPAPLGKLLLNDIGPQLEWPALQRIAAYVGQPARFENPQQGVEALRALSAGFGPHSEAQWTALSLPMLVPVAAPAQGWQWHYDPAIAVPFRSLTQEQLQQSLPQAWQMYDTIGAQTLLVRGAQSDLISAATAAAMRSRGPRARSIELEGVGHAPTFVADDQVAIAVDFFLGDE